MQRTSLQVAALKSSPKVGYNVVALDMHTIFRVLLRQLTFVCFRSAVTQTSESVFQYLLMIGRCIGIILTGSMQILERVWLGKPLV